eukprot:SAG11_NODE_11506_length_756_cov_1.106545_1_plen_200_part_01
MQELDLAAGDELALFGGRTDTAAEIVRLRGATLPKITLFCALGAELLLLLTTDGEGTAEGFRGRLFCTCADDDDWTSIEGQPCAGYRTQPQRAYCGSDGADVPCPVSCGHCTPSCVADADCGGGASRCERGACMCTTEVECQAAVLLELKAAAVCGAGHPECRDGEHLGSWEGGDPCAEGAGWDGVNCGGGGLVTGLSLS